MADFEGILEKAEQLFDVGTLGDQSHLSTQPQGPSQIGNHTVPDDYVDTFSDVARAKSLSILRDPDTHHGLYGASQGRSILAKIKAHKIERVVMISPSHLKECGIGEYGRYLSGELGKQVQDIRVVRTGSAALELGADFLKGALIVVNHGPGLFDGLNPRLSQGESTTRLLQSLDRLHKEMGALPILIHHSLLDTDHNLLFSRQAQIMAAGIPSITFISSAGRHFFMPHLELGVSPVKAPKHTYKGDRDERPEVVGFFGFFQYGGKDFDSLFHLVKELRGRLVGSVATGNADELVRFEETLEDRNLPHDLGSGWVDDTELLQRLKDADYFYLPQNDYDHWNNSATARFVTNLDRPLFLPPHHPFLDMHDGSIFASKEDLPRIVAHFREQGHYAKAVERVAKFRERASMANTASDLLNNLPERQGQIGEELLETASATSYERYLELGTEAQAEFAATLNADPSDPTTFPAIWRAPDPRQFWRKHYELGDFVHDTVLASISAIYYACTKRQMTYTELMQLVLTVCEKPGGDATFGDVLEICFHQAYENRGGPFYDPEIILLENGEVADWAALMSADKINAFKAQKLRRHEQISETLAAVGKNRGQPSIKNIAEMLILPKDVITKRRAAIDLSIFDWGYIHSVRRPAQRLNRLVEQANEHGIELSEHFVFDHLSVAEVEHQVTQYVLEDFVYIPGDAFLLNAVRCIYKRNPYSLEYFALHAILNRLGRLAVLRHLLEQARGRVEIVNLTETLAYDEADFTHLMHAARDPLFGLIEKRNQYEMQTRNVTRWWMRNKSETDVLIQTSNSDSTGLTLLYKALSTNFVAPTSKLDPILQIEAGTGHILAHANDLGTPMRLMQDRLITMSPTIRARFVKASNGFHDLEEGGVWTNGTRASLHLRLVASENDTTSGALRVQLRFFGTEHITEPRTVTLSLSNHTDDVSSPLVEQTHKVTSDADVLIDLPVEVATGHEMLTLTLEINSATSPQAAGVSPDKRVLGLRLETLEWTTG